MYAFVSHHAYLAVCAAKLTLAEAIESGYVAVAPRDEVVVARVGRVEVCFCGIPF